MVRKKRTKILIEGRRELSLKLAREILAAYDVKIIEGISKSLVMVKVRESTKGSLFYLGEVLITECKVMIKDALGIGMIKGHEPLQAYNLAVIDAAYNANLPETKEWTEHLLLAEKEIEADKQRLKGRVLKTKVNFATMDA